MASGPALKARQTSYQDTVINYNKQRGRDAILVTDDQPFSPQPPHPGEGTGPFRPGQFTALSAARCRRTPARQKRPDL